MKTRGQLEAEITEAMIRFEKEYMGRGPVDARTYIVDDMVIVRLKGVLTPAERQLVSSPTADRGRQLVKQMRSELIEAARTLLETVVKSILHRETVSLHTDISTAQGERVMIFILAGRPDYIES